MPQRTSEDLYLSFRSLSNLAAYSTILEHPCSGLANLRSKRSFSCEAGWDEEKNDLGGVCLPVAVFGFGGEVRSAPATATEAGGGRRAVKYGRGPGS